jgi:hypothetical protein
MRELILLSFIVIASTSIGYRVGYRVGYRNAAVAPSKPVYVTVDAFEDFNKFDNWFFPCNVIHIEIIERDETDEKFSSELNNVITKFVNNKEKYKSTFVKYCDGTSFYKNYCN